MIIRRLGLVVYETLERVDKAIKISSNLIPPVVSRKQAGGGDYAEMEGICSHRERAPTGNGEVPLMDQYSSGRRMVVAERSASVMIQIFLPSCRR